MVHRPLLPHQEPIVEYATSVKHPALFVDMRLGKTLCTIRALIARELFPALIVTKKSVIDVWENEFVLEGIAPLVMSSADWKRNFPSRPVYVTNYEAVLHNPNLVDGLWSSVVCDESTHLKNPKAKITKLFLRGFRECDARFILTGTPAPETPLEYVTQWIFLRGELFGCDSYWKFRARYCSQMGFDWQLRPGVGARLRNHLSDLACIVSRKDAGVGNIRDVQRRTISKSPIIKRYEREVKKEWALSGVEASWYFEVHQWLTQLASGFANGVLVCDNKIRELLDLVNSELKNEQLVVFCARRHEVDAIAERIPGSRKLDGRVKREDRSRVIEDFQRGVFRILVSTTKVAQHGIRLDAADTIVFFTAPTSHEEWAQCCERIESVNKSRALLYVYLVAEDTIDEDIYQALKTKSHQSKFYLKQVLKDWSAQWLA